MQQCCFQSSLTSQNPIKTPSFKHISPKQGDLKQAFLTLSNQTPRPQCPPNDELYASILELCASRKALAQGRQIHARVIMSDSASGSMFLSTKLVFMYGKCGSLSDGRKLFDKVHQRTIFTWNAIIGAYVSNGEPLGAVELYREMRVSDIPVDACTFPLVLKACGGMTDIDSGCEIHGLAIKSGFVSVVFVANALVAMYTKCNEFDRAVQLFDRMADKGDVVSWNSIISAYLANGQSMEALRLFREMQKEGVLMNSYTVVGALQACEEPSCLKLGMEIHAALLKTGQEFGIYEANALVVMYSRCGRLREAGLVFSEMDEKDNVSWNSMLSGFLQNELYTEAIGFFGDMLYEGHKTDQVSVISIVSASGRLGTVLNGMEAHAYAIKYGFHSDLQVSNTLIDMYAKCCHVNYMDRVFYNMANKDFISWTTAIVGNAQNSCYLEALELFRRVQIEGMKVDEMMIGSMLLACSGLKYIPHVKQIHSYTMRQGLFDHVLKNTIVDVYGGCGLIEYASRMFERIENKDVISWTSMMSCYIRNGFANEALEIFYRMIEVGIKPDLVALMSILTASASLSALKKGKEIHGFLLRKGLTFEESIASSLVDMYARCGDVDNSFRIFSRAEHKDLVLWTSMINASGMHGRGKEAVNLFKQMVQTGLEPDHIAFLSLLYACSHSGLVDEGRRCLEIMESKYGLKPWPEHYACVVDLLGRANCLDEAYNFVKRMPIEPTSAVWCALLGACRVYSNNEIGEIAAEKLLDLDPQNPGNYVLVSNVLASTEKWKDVDKMRMQMKDKGLKKNPACSWIDVDNKVHVFMVRDKSHPQVEEINSKLAQITGRLEKGGYEADTKFVLHNVQEEEKKRMLYGHSERLAIAFGLIGTPAGTTIRITKNLRVCGDCHVFTKLVSKLFKREIRKIGNSDPKIIVLAFTSALHIDSKVQEEFTLHKPKTVAEMINVVNNYIELEQSKKGKMKSSSVIHANKTFLSPPTKSSRRLHQYVVDAQKFLEEKIKRKEVKQEQGQGQACHLYMIEIEKGKKRKKNDRITSCCKMMSSDKSAKLLPSFSKAKRP
ncbi:hypothetical protein GIB67_018264 [Kingdonia uniflora]|uniref:DYW domain-containing protein n=1 Tax=Kingdonia uniflora TaxID=39325 RepID=A0A7J7LF86_9MAGN|nr:hypothetical protein GIB67_018264 [Kingdonia uniflora]